MSQMQEVLSAFKRSQHGVGLFYLSPPEAETDVQMVCLPPTGEGFFSFLPWSRPQEDGRFFFPGVGLWGAQFNWTADWSFAALAEAVADAVAAELSSSLIALCGYSFGGLLAFEAARRLRRRRERALLGLVVAVVSAPQMYHQARPVGEGWTTKEWRDELKRLGGTPATVLNDPEQLELVVPRVIGGLKISASYRYGEEAPFDDLPIAAFGGRRDQEFDPTDVLAWSEQTTADFTAHIYQDAEHFDLLKTPRVRDRFLADVAAALGRWRQGRPA